MMYVYASTSAVSVHVCGYTAECSSNLTSRALKAYFRSLSVSPSAPSSCCFMEPSRREELFIWARRVACRQGLSNCLRGKGLVLGLGASGFKDLNPLFKFFFWGGGEGGP